MLPLIVSVVLATMPVPDRQTTERMSETISQEILGHYPRAQAYVKAVISAESNWKSNAVSHAGAKGLMQLMPLAVIDARRECGLHDTFGIDLTRPKENIILGSCYLRWILKRKEVNGRWDLALIAYNGGFRQLKRFLKRQKIARETYDYVISVSILMMDYYSQERWEDD